MSAKLQRQNKTWRDVKCTKSKKMAKAISMELTLSSKYTTQSSVYYPVRVLWAGHLVSSSSCQVPLDKVQFRAIETTNLIAFPALVHGIIHKVIVSHVEQNLFPFVPIEYFSGGTKPQVSRNRYIYRAREACLALPPRKEGSSEPL